MKLSQWHPTTASERCIPKGRQLEAAIAPGGSPLGQRLRLWEIDKSMHCSILGTCLRLGDLRAIARRARYRLDPKASSYQVHSWFVDMVALPNELSKRVDKLLEKRYYAAACKIRGAGSEAELAQRWREVHAEGQIAGAYWAAMSHPLCSQGLRWRLFGEIHMLSHLVGASRRADLCRLHELELANAAQHDKHEQLRDDHLALVKEYERIKAALESRDRELTRLERLLVDAEQRLAALESGTLARDYEARARALEQRLGEAEVLREAAESSAAELRARVHEAMASEGHARQQAAELARENQVLERALMRGTRGALGAEPPACAHLGGKRIMYLGGRASLVPHYRDLIERHGGEFFHHDGGLEESLDGVTRALSSVDIVVCPMDCISHAACLLAKKACRHLAKSFVPLRNASLSSLASAVLNPGESTLAKARSC